MHLWIAFLVAGSVVQTDSIDSRSVAVSSKGNAHHGNGGIMRRRIPSAAQTGSIDSRSVNVSSKGALAIDGNARRPSSLMRRKRRKIPSAVQTGSTDSRSVAVSTKGALDKNGNARRPKSLMRNRNTLRALAALDPDRLSIMSTQEPVAVASVTTAAPRTKGPVTAKPSTSASADGAGISATIVGGIVLGIVCAAVIIAAAFIYTTMVWSRGRAPLSNDSNSITACATFPITVPDASGSDGFTASDREEKSNTASSSKAINDDTHSAPVCRVDIPPVCRVDSSKRPASPYGSKSPRGRAKPSLVVEGKKKGFVKSATVNLDDGPKRVASPYKGSVKPRKSGGSGGSESLIPQKPSERERSTTEQ